MWIDINDSNFIVILPHPVHFQEYTYTYVVNQFLTEAQNWLDGENLLSKKQISKCKEKKTKSQFLPLTLKNNLK
jgi:hypothetical protein